MSKAEKGVMNPYVSAKFGRYTKGDACRRIPRISGIVCKDGKAADVDFEKLEGMRTMLVPRAAGDDGVCYVDVWHDIGGHFGQHIGCAQIDVSVMTEIPAHGVGKEETLSVSLRSVPNALHCIARPRPRPPECAAGRCTGPAASPSSQTSLS